MNEPVTLLAPAGIAAGWGASVRLVIQVPRYSLYSWPLEVCASHCFGKAHVPKVTALRQPHMS